MHAHTLSALAQCTSQRTSVPSTQQPLTTLQLWREV